MPDRFDATNVASIVAISHQITASQFHPVADLSYEAVAHSLLVVIHRALKSAINCFRTKCAARSLWALIYLKARQPRYVTIKNEGNKMRSLLPTAVVIVLLGTIPQPASAQFYGPAPWCAVTDMGTGNMYWDCQYWSFQRCVSNVLAGNRGFCNRNPSFGPTDRGYRRPYRY